MHRVQFKMDRDIALNPPQAAPSPSDFIYPSVEVDGKEYSNVSLSFSFRDADSIPAAATTN